MPLPGLALVLLLASLVGCDASGDTESSRFSGTFTSAGGGSGPFGGSDIGVSTGALAFRREVSDPSGLVVAQIAVERVGAPAALDAVGTYPVIHFGARSRPGEFLIPPGSVVAVLTVVGPQESGGFYESRSGTLEITAMTETTIAGTLTFQAATDPFSDTAAAEATLTFRALR